ncbi:MAG: ROK family protein [Phycisphaerales bacterium]|nr:ROK family protein [Phycisphaerales bacterium]
MKVAIGIDVGGTAIKGGLVSSKGAVLEKDTIPTQAERGVKHVIERTVSLIQALEKTESADSVNAMALGVGVPGFIRRRQGLVVSSPNLEGWVDVPVVAMLEKATNRQVILDNDANNAALGEYVCGAGQGVRSMVMLTLGTGVGSGLILDGKLWRGANECGGELGHTIVQPDGRRCGCGQSGCLEAYASAESTARRTEELIRQGEASVLKGVLDRGEAITAKMVVDAARTEDALACRIWEDTCRYLALACINVQHTLNPECIVFAGGMSTAGDFLREPVARTVRKLHAERFGMPPEVRIAELGSDAGFIGAALSALRGE